MLRNKFSVYCRKSQKGGEDSTGALSSTAASYKMSRVVCRVHEQCVYSGRRDETVIHTALWWGPEGEFHLASLTPFINGYFLQGLNF